MRKTSKTPDTFHRVILSDGKWLRSPVVSNKGVVTEGQSDMFGLGRTAVLAEASAWPLDRARYIASQFPDAYVDRVATELGTTDHKVPDTFDSYVHKLSNWLCKWDAEPGVVLHRNADGLATGISLQVFTTHIPKRYGDVQVEFLFSVDQHTFAPLLQQVALPNISTTDAASVREYRQKMALCEDIITSFKETFPSKENA